MAYWIVASFDVPVSRREQFIVAAVAAGRDSCAGESGTLAFNVVEDATVDGRFSLVEAYRDAEAFDRHCAGAHFKRFFDTLAEWGQPEPEVVVRGADVEPR
jgi:quinol monooxygenase YgiN